MSADVTDLMYNVSVSGVDISPLTATISGTQYCPELTPCQEYTITVTPFSTSPNYVGMNTTIANTTTGGMYQQSIIHYITMDVWDYMHLSYMSDLGISI